MSTVNITVPDLSGAADVDVVEVFIKPGDKVEEGDSLIALETDKASMEVPATQSGVVVSVSVSEGDTINEGDALCVLEIAPADASAAEAPVAEVDAEPVAEAAPVAAAPAAASETAQVAVPDLSGATDVDVVEVFVKPGDTVAEGDS